MMSGNGDDTIHARNRSDRRVLKTRALLLRSFDRLLLARGYNDVSVREISADADVGRSTFYEHFESKEELLEHSVAHIISVLAAATATGAPSDALRDMLTHVGVQRSLSSELLQGSVRAIVIRVLACKLERYLAAIARRSAAPPIAPIPLLAVSLAHAQLGVIDAWLNGNGRCETWTAARVLHATTRAGVAAMFGSIG